jgi:hypothetical protein
LLLRSCLLYMKCVGRRVRRGEVATAPRRLEDGTACRRRVCFFTHTLDQLCVLPPCRRSQRARSSRRRGRHPWSPRQCRRTPLACSPLLLVGGWLARQQGARLAALAPPRRRGMTPAACSCSASPDEHWGRAATAAPSLRAAPPPSGHGWRRER